MTNLTNTMKKLLSFSLIIMLGLAFNSSKTYAQNVDQAMDSVQMPWLAKLFLIKQQLPSLMVAQGSKDGFIASASRRSMAYWS